MTAPIDVEALGRRVRIDVDDDVAEEQRETLRSAWSGALCADERAADSAVPFAADGDFDLAMERLTIDVTLTALDALRGTALMFHAAGVADADGRVAAFVGPSGRGKTTLSRALGQSYGYVSDETIAVDAAGHVHPYRKPLSIVQPTGPKHQVSPRAAGLRELPNVPLRLTALVLIERDEDLGSPEISTIPLTEALPQLVAQMSYLRECPEPLQAIARLSDALGGVQLLRYPDASGVAPLVPQILQGGAGAEAWEALSTTDRSAGEFDVSCVDDAISTEDGVVVMVAGNLQVLGGIAPVIWRAASQGAGLDEIVAQVVAEFGGPPEGDAVTLVESAIDDLIAAGVLRRR